jgi:tRNA (adenine57-N1/adenine58-N1)-methyltransferase
MLSRREFIKEGDWAIAYEAYNMMKIFQVKTGDMLQNRLGSFRHEDFIGKRYGTPMNCLGKLNSKCIILHMSPYLWTAALSVRTQILFQVDISMVLYHLDLRPGSIVLESGTGSGSLTTSMARVVAPHGHIHSFEFNADRVEKANIDFKNNKLDDVVTCRHRDVCAKGFPFFPQGVDAVFLDLPTPWEALDDCHRNLRPQGKIFDLSIHVHIAEDENNWSVFMRMASNLSMILLFNRY